MAADTLNPTAAAMLGFLHDGPRTGGELVAAARDRLGSFWTLTRSQVYRELPALAERGLVKAGKPGARQSQPYTVTATGRRAFKKWLAEPAGRDSLRNPLMLRLAFGAAFTPEQLSGVIEQQRAEHVAALEAYRSRLKAGGFDPFVRASLDFGVAYEKAVIKWLDALPATLAT